MTERGRQRICVSQLKGIAARAALRLVLEASLGLRVFSIGRPLTKKSAHVRTGGLASLTLCKWMMMVQAQLWTERSADSRPSARALAQIQHLANVHHVDCTSRRRRRDNTQGILARSPSELSPPG